MSESAVAPGAEPSRPERLTLRRFFADAGDELLSLDRGLPYTFLMLFQQPRRVIGRFIEWRDARLTKPLRYFLIVVLVVNAIAAIGNPARAPAADPSAATTASAVASSAGEAAAAAGDRIPAVRKAGWVIGKRIGDIWSQHLEWVLLLFVPFLALACRRVFASSGYNFAEFWVFNLYAFAQCYWLIGVALVLRRFELILAAWLVSALIPLLFVWICINVLELRPFDGGLRAAYAMALATAALAAVFLALVALVLATRAWWL